MCGDFCEYLCSVICPPIAVLAATGCSCDFLVNILLTIAFYFPGCCHACYVVGQARKKKYGRGGIGNNVNVFVAGGAGGGGGTGGAGGVSNV